MYRTIALTTVLAVFATLPATPAAAADATELLLEKHFSQDSYEIDLYVTRDGDSGILSEATLTDPTVGDAVDLWTDGFTVWWDGTIDGEPVAGSMAALDINADTDSEGVFCLTPVSAIICLGAILIATSASCATTSNACPPKGTNDPSSGIPGGGGGVPDGGGDGDGDSGDGGKTGGGDED